jgi:hypothetical protein
MTTILFRVIFAICYDNYTKPINTISGQNAKFILLELVVHSELLSASIIRATLEAVSTSGVGQTARRRVPEECHLHSLFW